MTGHRRRGDRSKKQINPLLAADADAGKGAFGLLAQSLSALPCQNPGQIGVFSHSQWKNTRLPKEF